MHIEIIPLDSPMALSFHEEITDIKEIDLLYDKYMQIIKDNNYTEGLLFHVYNNSDDNTPYRLFMLTETSTYINEINIDED